MWIKGVLEEFSKLSSADLIGGSTVLQQDHMDSPNESANDNKPKISTIFFGGGTPSLMQPQNTEKILDTVFKRFNCTDDIEITLEANPNSSEVERFRDFKHAGINRLSIGVQSFDQKELEFLGRKHSAKEGISAIENGLSIFDRVSFDLIYALPDQTLEQWKKNLEFGLSFGTKHLSLYQLVIEPGTPFEMRYKRKEFEIPLDEKAVEFYETTLAMVQKKGIHPYEVSNFSVPGEECRHNLCYWNYEDYIGVGPGAHGRFYAAVDTAQAQYDKMVFALPKKIHRENNKVPEVWIKNKIKKETILSEEQQAFERLMMGLRLFNGIPFEPVEKYIDKQALGDLIEGGYLKFGNNCHPAFMQDPVKNAWIPDQVGDDTTCQMDPDYCQNDSTEALLIPTLKGILCHGSIVNYLFQRPIC